MGSQVPIKNRRYGIMAKGMLVVCIGLVVVLGNVEIASAVSPEEILRLIFWQAPTTLNPYLSGADLEYPELEASVNVSTLLWQHSRRQTDGTTGDIPEKRVSEYWKDHHISMLFFVAFCFACCYG